MGLRIPGGGQPSQVLPPAVGELEREQQQQTLGGAPDLGGIPGLRPWLPGEKIVSEEPAVSIGEMTPEQIAAFFKQQQAGRAPAGQVVEEPGGGPDYYLEFLLGLTRVPEEQRRTLVKYYNEKVPEQVVRFRPEERVVGKRGGPPPKMILEYRKPGEKDWTEVSPDNRDGLATIAAMSGVALEMGVAEMGRLGVLGGMAVLTGALVAETMMIPTTGGMSAMAIPSTAALLYGVASQFGAGMIGGMAAPLVREKTMEAMTGIDSAYRTGTIMEGVWWGTASGAFAPLLGLGTEVTGRTAGMLLSKLKGWLRGSVKRAEAVAAVRTLLRQGSIAYRFASEKGQAYYKKFGKRAAARRRAQIPGAGPEGLYPKGYGERYTAVEVEEFMVKKKIPWGKELGEDIKGFVDDVKDVHTIRMNQLEGDAIARLGDEKIPIDNALNKLKEILGQSGVTFKANGMIRTADKNLVSAAGLKEVTLDTGEKVFQRAAKDGPGAIIRGQRVDLEVAARGKTPLQEAELHSAFSSPHGAAFVGDMLDTYNRLAKMKVAHGGVPFRILRQDLRSFSKLAQYESSDLPERQLAEAWRGVRDALSIDSNRGFERAYAGTPHAGIVADLNKKFTAQIGAIEKFKTLFNELNDPEFFAEILMAGPKRVAQFKAMTKKGFIEPFADAGNEEMVKIMRRFAGGKNSEIWSKLQGGWMSWFLKEVSHKTRHIPDWKKMISLLGENEPAIRELLGHAPSVVKQGKPVQMYDVLMGYARSLDKIDIDKMLARPNLGKQISDLVTYCVVKHPFVSTRARTLMRLVGADKNWVDYFIDGGLDEIAAKTLNPLDKIKLWDTQELLQKAIKNLYRAERDNKGVWKYRIWPMARKAIRTMPDPIMREYLRPYLLEKEVLWEDKEPQEPPRIPETAAPGIAPPFAMRRGPMLDSFGPTPGMREPAGLPAGPPAEVGPEMPPMEEPPGPALPSLRETPVR